MQFVLIALGVLATAISLIELAGHLIGGLHTLRRLTGPLLGRSGEQQSGMDEAMFWVRVIGLFLVGGLAIVAGLSVLEA